MSVLYEQIIKLIFTALSLVFSSIVLPWIVKTGIPWLKEKRLDGIVKKYVEAAEKMAASGQISKDMKKEFVRHLLETRGIHITEEVNALIEAAVIECDHASAQALFLIHEAFADDHIHGENGEVITFTQGSEAPVEPTE